MAGPQCSIFISLNMLFEKLVQTHFSELDILVQPIVKGRVARQRFTRRRNAVRGNQYKLNVKELDHFFSIHYTRHQRVGPKQTATTMTTTTTTPTKNSNNVTEQEFTPPSWLKSASVIDHAPLQVLDKKKVIADAQHDDDDDDKDTPGVLHGSITYTPKKTLAEGYVHLKGSGKDWLGSRAWKPRYARLVLATVQGMDDVPLLLIYWFQSSTEPSTVITLDSTVVLPVEKEDKTVWNAYGLEVIHVTSRGEQRVTRTFTAGSQNSRDAWLLVLNQTLLQYEKTKAQLKKRNQSPPNAPRSPPMGWNDDRFVTVMDPKPLPPPPTSPTSPRSSEKLPLPRSDVLAGESLLA